MNDTSALSIRYLVTIAFATWLGSITKGAITGDVAKSIAETLIEGGVAAAGTFGPWLWALFVRWNTKAVPLSTANRADVPTVNNLTGAVQR